MKKTIAILCIIILAVSIVVTSVNAQDSNGYFGSDLYWEFDDATGTLTISGNGAMPDFDWSGSSSGAKAVARAITEWDAPEVTTVAETEATTTTTRWTTSAPTTTAPMTTTTTRRTTAASTTTADWTTATTARTTEWTTEAATTTTIYENTVPPDSPDTSGAVVPWYGLKPYVKAVVIEDGITYIGNYAFENCRHLTSVTIPDSVSTIGFGAFYDCVQITNINSNDGSTNVISGNVTSIGKYAFYGCVYLNSVHYLGDRNQLMVATSSFNSISSTFTFLPLSSTTSIVNSRGKPNVSYNKNASLPEIVSDSVFSMISNNLFSPASNVLKKLSSSILIIFSTRACFSNK